LLTYPQKVRNRLTSKTALASFARGYRFPDRLILGKQGRATAANNADSTLECTFESYVGALVFQSRKADGGDGGVNTATVYRWYQQLLTPYLDAAMEKALEEIAIETANSTSKKRKVAT
jgi:dsRNA-specific ribonuclease